MRGLLSRGLCWYSFFHELLQSIFLGYSGQRGTSCELKQLGPADPPRLVVGKARTPADSREPKRKQESTKRRPKRTPKAHKHNPEKRHDLAISEGKQGLVFFCMFFTIWKLFKQQQQQQQQQQQEQEQEQEQKQEQEEQQEQAQEQEQEQLQQHVSFCLHSQTRN